MANAEKEIEGVPLNGIRVTVNEYLPGNTIMCSPNIYAVLKETFSEPDGKATA